MEGLDWWSFPHFLDLNRMDAIQKGLLTDGCSIAPPITADRSRFSNEAPTPPPHSVNPFDINPLPWDASHQLKIPLAWISL